MDQSTIIEPSAPQTRIVAAKPAALQEPRFFRYVLTFIALAFLAFFIVLPSYRFLLQPFKKGQTSTLQQSHIQML